MDRRHRRELCIAQCPPGLGRLANPLGRALRLTVLGRDRSHHGWLQSRGVMMPLWCSRPTDAAPPTGALGELLLLSKYEGGTGRRARRALAGPALMRIRGLKRRVRSPMAHSQMPRRKGIATHLPTSTQAALPAPKRLGVEAAVHLAASPALRELTGLWPL